MLNVSSGKISQLAFAFIASKRNPIAVVINLIAGGIAESGACQAADFVCTLKAGHLLGASPMNILQGQVIGCVFGALVAPLAYMLFTSSDPNHSGMTQTRFGMPSAHMWFEAAKQSLSDRKFPEMALETSIGIALSFLVIAGTRIFFTEASWVGICLPNGVSFALGKFKLL